MTLVSRAVGPRASSFVDGGASSAAASASSSSSKSESAPTARVVQVKPTLRVTASVCTLLVGTYEHRQPPAETTKTMQATTDYWYCSANDVYLWRRGAAFVFTLGKMDNRSPALARLGNTPAVRVKE